MRKVFIKYICILCNFRINLKHLFKKVLNYIKMLVCTSQLKVYLLLCRIFEMHSSQCFEKKKDIQL